jgi:CRP-like cAMP-binding protein
MKMPLETIPMLDISGLANILSHSQLFYGLPKANLENLLSHTSLVRSPRDSALFSENQMNARVPGLFIVLEGAVRLEFWNLDLGRGNFFGEAALFEIPLAAVETTGPVRTLEPCMCLLITRDQLIAWFTRHPLMEGPFYRHLAAALCQRAYFNREWAATG